MRDIIRLALCLLLGVAVLWAGAGFLGEMGGAVASFDAQPVNAAPFSWRAGMAPTVRLGQCLGAARPLLPSGSVVAFVSAGPEQSDYYRWRWAAYLMPDLHVVRWDDRRAAPPAGFVLSYHVPVDQHGLAFLRQLPGGRLYRVTD